jgi:hypothetical protein
MTSDHPLYLISIDRAHVARVVGGPLNRDNWELALDRYSQGELVPGEAILVRCENNHLYREAAQASN